MPKKAETWGIFWWCTVYIIVHRCIVFVVFLGCTSATWWNLLWNPLSIYLLLATVRFSRHCSICQGCPAWSRYHVSRLCAAISAARRPGDMSCIAGDRSGRSADETKAKPIRAFRQLIRLLVVGRQLTIFRVNFISATTAVIKNTRLTHWVTACKANQI